jgi:pteridine reductase
LISSNRQVEKTALVTGAARRIGRAIVEDLHKAGFKVAIHCHNSLAEAESLASHLNKIRLNSAQVFQQNLLEINFQSFIQKIIFWAGSLDLLVNNASLFLPDDTEDWNQSFDVNVRAPFLLSQAAFPTLAKTEGVIINITDIHAAKPLKNYAIYCQTKAALNMQTKSLAKELAPKVRVNAIAPGAIAWPEGMNALSSDLQKKIIDKTLLKRHGEPHFIAQAVRMLAENKFITGQIVNVDGGRSIN